MLELLMLACLFVATPVYSLVHNSTALFLATDDSALENAKYLFDGYGLNYTQVAVPQEGIELPELEMRDGGNFGLIVVVSQVMYGTTQRVSALTDDQWNSLYDYQTKYGVRMVQLAVAPGQAFGVNALGSCCDKDEEQFLTLVESIQESEFPTAGLK